MSTDTIARNERTNSRQTARTRSRYMKQARELNKLLVAAEGQLKQANAILAKAIKEDLAISKSLAAGINEQLAVESRIRVVNCEQLVERCRRHVVIVHRQIYSLGVKPPSTLSNGDVRRFALSARAIFTARERRTLRSKLLEVYGPQPVKRLGLDTDWTPLVGVAILLVFFLLARVTVAQINIVPPPTKSAIHPTRHHHLPMVPPSVGLAVKDKYKIPFTRYLAVYNAAYAAGFRKIGLVRAVAVSSGESSMVEHGHDLINLSSGTCGPTNRDRGAWQINSCWHKEVSDACAYNYKCAAKAVYRISRKGRNWGAWCTWYARCDTSNRPKGVAQKRLPEVQRVLGILNQAGVINITTADFVFPVRASKHVLMKADPAVRFELHCIDLRSNAVLTSHNSRVRNAGGCHHDYRASDIGAPTGTPVVAARAGVVINTSPDSGSVGYTVKIWGDDGHAYYYAHLLRAGEGKAGGPKRYGIFPGKRVKLGQRIGAIGTKADSQNTKPHLHFQIMPDKARFEVGAPGSPLCGGGMCPDRYKTISPQPLLINAFKRLPH